MDAERSLNGRRVDKGRIPYTFCKTLYIPPLRLKKISPPLEIILTEPSGIIGTPTNDRSAFNASFGRKVLPARRLNCLAGYMGRVRFFVRHFSNRSLFSISYGLRYAHNEPPVDWVEGVDIMILIVLTYVPHTHIRYPT